MSRIRRSRPWQVGPTAPIIVDPRKPFARGLAFAYAASQRGDIVGGGRTTLVGSATIRGSKPGMVVETTSDTGQGAYCYAQRATALQTTQQTLMVYARLDTLSAWGALLAYPHVLGSHSSPFHRLSLYQRTVDTVGRFQVCTAGGSFAYADSNSGYFTTGWAVYWALRDGDSVEFYRDSTSYGTGSGTGSTVPGVDASTPFFLLERNTATGEGIDGAVALALLWNRKITAGERLELTGDPWAFAARVPTRRSFAVAAGAGAQTITPTGIATGEAFGTAVIAPGAVTVTPTGIATAEAFGTAVVAPGAVSILPTGIDSGEAFGTAVLSTGAVSVAPSAIDSAEAFGSHVVNAGGAAIVPDGIASAEAFGTTIVAPGAVTVAPNGIETGEAFGDAVVSAGGLLVIVEGIASAEAFGSHTLTPGAVVVTVTGIESAEAFGTAALSSLVSILAQAIDSAEAFGTAEVDVGSAVILPSGIASLEAFGTAFLTGGSALTPARSRLLVVPRELRQFDA